MRLDIKATHLEVPSKHSIQYLTLVPSFSRFRTSFSLEHASSRHDMDDKSPSNHQHDSETTSTHPDDEGEICIDTDDDADFVWLKGSRYSYTERRHPSWGDQDLEKKYDLHPKHLRSRNSREEEREEDDSRNMIDERAGEPGYKPQRVEEETARVAAAECAGSSRAQDNVAKHSHQLQEWTALRLRRERAEIDATVTALEGSQNAVPGPTSPRSAAARDSLRSLVESNSENVLVRYEVNKWFPQVLCQYPLCPLPNRDISNAGGSYVSLEHYGDWKDLTPAPDIEVYGDDGETRLIPVFDRTGRDQSLRVCGTFCVVCLKELCTLHV
ncbi:hypothetical protein IWX49DRAFT_389806 [Phyllosticta citricarpa]|uniref:Uncharacterized protein n=2 Tax=Phyllosticta TaxID=121621 RepID=A0ABR1MEU1_9PEZI